MSYHRNKEESFFYKQGVNTWVKIARENVSVQSILKQVFSTKG